MEIKTEKSFLSRKKDKHNERKLIWKRYLSKCLEIFISKILNCCDYETKTIQKLLERAFSNLYKT